MHTVQERNQALKDLCATQPDLVETAMRDLCRGAEVVHEEYSVFSVSQTQGHPRLTFNVPAVSDGIVLHGGHQGPAGKADVVVMQPFVLDLLDERGWTWGYDFDHRVPPARVCQACPSLLQCTLEGRLAHLEAPSSKIP